MLVVDDNRDTAIGMAMLLKASGYEVNTAFDGATAIEQARGERPDFVLLDLGLPGLDGYEVARQLRREESFKDTILIAVSGYGQQEDRQRSRQAGFDHHLIKPVDYDSLFVLLDRKAHASPFSPPGPDSSPLPGSP